MRYLLVIVFAFNFLRFASCQEKTNQDAEHLSEHTQTPLTDSHTRLKGTRVYCVLPSGYNYYKHNAQYEKNEYQYVKIRDTGLSNFAQAKSYLTKEVLEKSDERVISHISDVTLNGYDGVYNESINQQGQAQLELFFGDSSFIATVTAVYKADDIKAKEELLNILKSVHYNKTIEIDPLQEADIWLDLSITGFRHTATTYMVYMFAENGAEDAHNQYSNSLFFRFLSEKNEGELYDFLYWFTKDYEKSFKLRNRNITKTKINDYTAYVLDTEIFNNGRFGVLYQVALVNNKDILLFVAKAYDNADDYLVKFKKTVETIVLL